MDNVSVFFAPTLTATGRKVPVDQYTLEVKVIGYVPDVGKAAAKKEKKQTLTWPECLDMLTPERKYEIIREVLVEAARVDTEKSESIKEG